MPVDQPSPEDLRRLAEGFDAIYSQGGSGMAERMGVLLKPILIESLKQAQEDPDRRFVVTVGGEPMIDYDRLFAAITGFAR